MLAYFIAYGALSVSGVACLVFLVARAVRPRSRGAETPFVKGVRTWIFRAGQIGFPFLTLGIVLGALWAQVAWGDYWSWDPKEVWALITWLLVAAWLHLWHARNRGVLAAIVMVLAVGALYFTFFGMGLLPTAPQSIHVYVEQ